MFVPDAAHALFTQARRFRHGARAPVARVGGLLLRGFRITSRTLAAVMVGARPGRGASFSNPASPIFRKRFRRRAGAVLRQRGSQVDYDESPWPKRIAYGQGWVTF